LSEIPHFNISYASKGKHLNIAHIFIKTLQKNTTERKKDAAIRREKVLCCWWEIFTEIANLGAG
jgi:hypothetical protein